MLRVMVDCPSCRKPVPTGFAVTKESWETASFEGNMTTCPHCTKPLVWDKAEAYLEHER
jgi:endogenous inhibitor of DNA gyrase (YacG/DUF329 family)